jgi:formylglycine-generating enzyme
MIVVLCVLSMPSASAAEDTMASIPGGSLAPFYRSLKDGPAVVPTEPVVAFQLDRFPVTNTDFLQFVQAYPRWRRTEIKPIFADAAYLQHWHSATAFPKTMAHAPVTHVSWFAAKAYCHSVGKRLPTMHEWEYVARASETAFDASQTVAFQQRILAWYGVPTPMAYPAVGSFYKNAYGVHDMHGLVWEWVLDFNSVLLTGESRGDSGLERKLYCAGGAVGVTDPGDYASFMRYAFRASLKAQYTVGNLGFRCAKGGTHE